jgi:ABC-2 type transport system ATP-binding protein
MTAYGTWVSYSGSARIWLAIGLLAAVACMAFAGFRLRLPARLKRRPSGLAAGALLAVWFTSLPLFLGFLAIYVQNYVHAYPNLHAAPPSDPIAPVTFLSAIAVFVAVLVQDAPRFWARVGGAAVAAMAAPMIFEVPFDLIVMSRTYPAIHPDPALNRVLFFAPLFLIELTTLALLSLTSMVTLRRSTFFSFALMLAVFSAWALTGFGYPSSPAPIAFNVISKLLAFVTVLTLYFPRHKEQSEVSPPDPAAAWAGTGQPAIVVHGLRKSFGAKEAVAGIDLEIAAGSLAGLVGPNGAGKTTSLSMMTGLLRPDAGEVTVAGVDVWASPAAAKAVIGVVPAEARLFERLSGAEMLEYAGRLHGLPADQARSRAAELMSMLDLGEDARRLVADYSTGMRKKISLGCALIHNPAVLFLDEPLEGVDPVSADVIRRLLTRLTAAGATVLFSSHVMELVEQVCDQVFIVDKGQIVADGSTAAVRGGKSLQQAFIDLVGPQQGEEGLTWLGSSSA